MASGGVLGSAEELDQPQLGLRELTAGVEEAHHKGIKVAAHAYTPVPIKMALDAGVDSIEHGSHLDEETARQMRSRGTFLVPTMTAYEVMSRRAEAVDAPAHIRRKTEVVREASKAATRLAMRLGVPIAAGSDSAGSGNYHGSFPEEVRLLVDCGATVEEAVRICTSAGAELCGVSADRGALSSGLRADLLVVRGDLLKDVSRIGDPLLVLKDGVHVWEHGANPLN
jgi:imidazolonepropionase-like amidohydrolase